MPGGQPGALGWGQPAAQRAAARQPVLLVIMKAKPKNAARVLFVMPVVYRFASKKMLTSQVVFDNVDSCWHYIQFV